MSGPERLPRRPQLERLWHPELPWWGWPIWLALVPAAGLYSAAMAGRSALGRLPWVRRRAGGLKVIGVGNLTVGGNRKTPFALYLARKLAERGLRVAIVSRGYGGSSGGGRAQLVADGGRLLLGPDEAGDEAVMMAKSFDGPIAIAAHRLAAVRMLERRGELEAVILDDAFQQLGLRPDLDFVVINFERGLGNSWTLPAGPMRERLSAIRRAHAVVLLRADRGSPGALSRVQMAELGRRAELLSGTIRPRLLVAPGNAAWSEAPLGILKGRRVTAVSGLADARSFHQMLRDLRAELASVLDYPDHHRYTAADWDQIVRAAAVTDLVVTTEKDLVKLERFPLKGVRMFALRLEVAMEEDEERLLAMVIGGHTTPGAAAACRGMSKGDLRMALSQELLDILACPKCKGTLRLTETQDGLVCEACKLLYPVKDDIPVMLIDEAQPLK